MNACALFNSGELVVNSLFIADTPWLRLRGLLGRKPIAEQQGLLISPCNSVHTIGMSYSIDVVYLDKNKNVVKIVENLTPYRASICTKATQVIELQAGNVIKKNIKIGDKLSW